MVYSFSSPLFNNNSPTCFTLSNTSISSSANKQRQFDLEKDIQCKIVVVCSNAVNFCPSTSYNREHEHNVIKAVYSMCSNALDSATLSTSSLKEGTSFASSFKNTSLASFCFGASWFFSCVMYDRNKCRTSSP